ncbi:TPA: membrane protein insertase YidC [Candidatus Saccharibacteria bacterium]|nr:membrane protein insertase YidC [Candidatus Saccharibacteria bacterium]HIO87841.1 membrane protein insertase YidC [Candidatus Saccharibacteria bacterium]
MFRTILLLPLFNALFVIYALLPGNNFGWSIVIFTLLIRVLLWPLLKKQLHQQKAMKELQPEIAKIKKKSKGDKQKEAAMLMELYKEREINPLASLGTLIIQLPILITLFVMLRGLLDVEGAALAEQIANNAYGFVAELGFVERLINNPELFDPTFFGIHLRDPNIVLAVLAGLSQFAQSKGLQPKSDDAKTLRQILQDAKDGKATDQAEQTAAVARSASLFLPILTVVFALNLPSALALYWLTSSFVATIQQRVALNEEVSLLSKVKVGGRFKRSQE